MTYIVCILAGTECLLLCGLVCLYCRHRRTRRLSANRLRLLHSLIELQYLFKDRPLVLVRKFQEETCVRKLKDSDIIHWRRPSHGTNVNDDELFLYQLLKAGFSRKAICVIFELKSINSLYVKFHRLKKKLNIPE